MVVENYYKWAVPLSVVFFLVLYVFARVVHHEVDNWFLFGAGINTLIAIVPYLRKFSNHKAM
jgi:hypothetical protein